MTALAILLGLKRPAHQSDFEMERARKIARVRALLAEISVPARQ